MADNRSSYDDLPYMKAAFPQTHPVALWAIGALFGLDSPVPQRCRVLELGSASGTNLISMAYYLPESEFVGVELSEKQAAEAASQIEHLGLKNVTVHSKNIMDVDASLGQFDYVLVHGVYAWVPEEVQQKILSICAANLSPNGIAYVSYNVLPGWYFLRSIRELMLFHASKFEDPLERVRQGITFAKLCSKTAAQRQDGYSQLLHSQLEAILEKPESYVAHEYLEDSNEPLYFHDFMRRAGACGLQYLGESSLNSMGFANKPAGWEQVPHDTSEHLIALEQYVDFLTNRQFRCTLLCHDKISLKRDPDVNAIARLAIRSQAKKATGEDGQTLFTSNQKTLRSADPATIAAMDILIAAYPQAVSFSALMQSVPEADGDTSVRQAVMETLLAAASHGLVSFVAPAEVEQASEPGRLNDLARAQLEDSAATFSEYNELVTLGDLNRQIALMLDGRSHEAVLNELVRNAKQGQLELTDDGKPISNSYRIKSLLKEQLEVTVAGLAKYNLLAR